MGSCGACFPGGTLRRVAEVVQGSPGHALREVAMGATIFRRTRFATAGGLALMLGVAFLSVGCGGAQAPEEPYVRPMDVNPAYAREVGRLVLDEYGYERLMNVAERAGWVKRVPRRRDNALGQVISETFVFVLSEKRFCQ